MTNVFLEDPSDTMSVESFEHIIDHLMQCFMEIKIDAARCNVDFRIGNLQGLKKVCEDMKKGYQVRSSFGFCYLTLLALSYGHLSVHEAATVTGLSVEEMLLLSDRAEKDMELWVEYLRKEKL